MSTSDVIIEKALALPERAKAVQIVDGTSYTAAGEILLAVKAMRKEIEGVFGPMKSKAHAAWKAVCEEEKKADAPLVEAEGIVKREMARYDTEQERIRMEEQRRLEAEARRLEEERRRKEADALEAERMRLEELARQQEAERLKQAEELAAAGKTAEAEAAMQAAIEAEQRAKEEADRISAEVAAVKTEPFIAPVIQIPKAMPKVQGISFREVWRGECTDLKALVKAAAADDRYLPLLQANTAVIGAQARSLKSAFKVPGVRVYCEKTTAAGGR